jgi:hypothetical protein
LIGSGKGTVADILERDQGFIKLSFADSLKDAVAAVFGWQRHLLEGNTNESREWREIVDQWWASRLGLPELTPRWVLQYWGTEVCRHGFHNDIWIASMERKLIRLQSLSPAVNVVIPDTRFPNEIDMIKSINGRVWQVKRGQDPIWFTQYVLGGDPPADIHQSEWEWTKSTFSCTIRNDGSLEELNETILVNLLK